MLSRAREVQPKPGRYHDRMTGFIATFDGGAELMTKAELVARVAQRAELTNKQTAEIIDLFLQCIMEALQAGDKVELRGFGSFRCRDRQPRQGRNPRTGDPVEVPARTVPVFRAGSILQAQLNSDLTPSSSLT